MTRDEIRRIGAELTLEMITAGVTKAETGDDSLAQLMAHRLDAEAKRCRNVAEMFALSSELSHQLATVAGKLINILAEHANLRPTELWANVATGIAQDATGAV